MRYAVEDQKEIGNDNRAEENIVEDRRIQQVKCEPFVFELWSLRQKL